MHLHTKKQKAYFKEVIRLHYEKGYGEDRISRILPIGHSTVSRWIAIFAAENDKKSVQMPKSKLKTQAQPRPVSPDANAIKGLQASRPVDLDANAIKGLQAEVARLQDQLNHERLRAEAYDEMINVAETMFKIAIRKKAGAKR